MKSYAYHFPPSWNMGNFSVNARDNAEALTEYNDYAKRSADHDCLPRPAPLAQLPRGTYKILQGETRKRYLRFPQAWEFEVRGTYAGQECDVNTCKTYADAKISIKNYRENDKGIPFRIVKVKAS